MRNPIRFTAGVHLVDVDVTGFVASEGRAVVAELTPSMRDCAGNEMCGLLARVRLRIVPSLIASEQKSDCRLLEFRGFDCVTELLGTIAQRFGVTAELPPFPRDHLRRDPIA